MATATRGVDTMGVYLSGGSSNTDPAASLGGAPSTTRIRALGFKLDTPIPGVQINEVFAANGEGTGSLAVNSAGDLVWTPPGGTAGTAVTVAAGSSAILAGGSDSSKAIKVTRESGLAWVGVDAPELVWPMNGWLGQGNLTSAERVAGKTTYRAIFLKSEDSSVGFIDPSIWFPAVGGAQATYSVAFETPSGGLIQTIADEETAPTGLSWSSPTTEGAAAVGGTVAAGNYLGVWIRRVFPAAGTVSVREGPQMAIKYTAAVYE